MCPVKKDCEDYGVVHEEFGTWGGKTQTEIRLARRANPTLLAYEAIKGGWLESHHLLPRNDVLEAQALVDAHEQPPDTVAYMVDYSEHLNDFLSFIPTQQSYGNEFYDSLEETSREAS